MKILVSLEDNTIIDGGSDYTIDSLNRFVSTRGIVYGFLNPDNAAVFTIDDFEYDQTIDGGRYLYVDGEIHLNPNHQDNA